MARPIKDLTGQRFGRLTVIRRIERKEGLKSNETWWEMKCDCGATHKSGAGNLKSGKTQSCGCLRREIARRVGLGNRKKDPADG